MSSRPGAASDAELAAAIAAGAAALPLTVGAPQVEAFVAYLRLVERWNATYNLTAVRDVRAMVGHHVLDCLAAAAALVRHRPLATTRRVLDVGSGAGLPGLVLATMLPATEVVCIDRVGKKTAFISQAAATMGAVNAHAVHGRIEAFEGGLFDVVTSRAFSSLAELVERTAHVLDPEGEWMAMKARRPDAELAELREVTFHVEPVSVPALDGERCVVWMQFERESDRLLSGKANSKRAVH